MTDGSVNSYRGSSPEIVSSRLFARPSPPFGWCVGHTPRCRPHVVARPVPRRKAARAFHTRAGRSGASMRPPRPCAVGRGRAALVAVGVAGGCGPRRWWPGLVLGGSLGLVVWGCVVASFSLVGSRALVVSRGSLVASLAAPWWRSLVGSALAEVKLRLLATRHFPAVPLAGATEPTGSGSAGPSAETATVREVWFATESAAPQGHRSIRYGPTDTCWKGSPGWWRLMWRVTFRFSLFRNPISRS